MKLTLKDAPLASTAADLLVLPMAEGQKASVYAEIEKPMSGMIAKAIASGEFRAKPDEALIIHTHGKISAARIMLLGLGPEQKIDAERVRQAGGRAASGARAQGLQRLAVAGSAFVKRKLSPGFFAEGAMLSQYEFTRYKDSDPGRKPVSALTVLCPAKEHKRLSVEMKTASVIAMATAFARDLVNTPAREMTPTDMLRAARSIKGISVKVIEAREAERLGMHAYLSISRGSHEPPKFIVLEWKGKAAEPIVLIGKSITFDSGGLSLKPSDGMEKMKYDMAGGGAVLGAMLAAVELNIKHRIIGILPATENLPSATPTRPGDVVRTIGGKTIEILNTDAEGRLALADALGYANKFLRPLEIIDLATLTGACTVALGDEAMAMFGTDEALVGRVQRAADATGERAWRMPLFDEYGEYMKSSIADFQNISAGRTGGLVTSGWFLKQFAGDTPWVHLDIASTAWRDKPRPYTPRGASGMGTRLLINYLMNR